MEAEISGAKVAIKHMPVMNDYQYALVKTLRELQIMEYLTSSQVRKQGADIFFAGLLDAFSPT